MSVRERIKPIADVNYSCTVNERGNVMRRMAEYTAVFAVGAVGYALIELLWRGRTHWTMMLTGGVCMAFIYHTEKRYCDAPRWKRCLADTEMISLCELAVGFFVNILFDWHVWDYSSLPLNIFGQICPLYAFLWFMLCLPTTYMCTAMQKYILRRRADAASETSAL